MQGTTLKEAKESSARKDRIQIGFESEQGAIRTDAYLELGVEEWRHSRQRDASEVGLRLRREDEVPEDARQS